MEDGERFQPGPHAIKVAAVVNREDPDHVTIHPRLMVENPALEIQLKQGVAIPINVRQRV